VSDGVEQAPHLSPASAMLLPEGVPARFPRAGTLADRLALSEAA